MVSGVLTGRFKIVFSLILTVLLISSVGVGPVLAQAHGGSTGSAGDDGNNPSEDWNTDGIICNNGSGEAGSAQTILKFVLGVFMLFGFLFGILAIGIDRLEIAIPVETEAFDNIEGMESLRKAILIPIMIFLFDLISEPLFGIDISCIVPQLG